MKYPILIYGNPESRAIWEGLTTDRPFAEAKELLAGFFLLDCESIERALDHAARVPEAEPGLVEVRPVLDLGGLEM